MSDTRLVWTYIVFQKKFPLETIDIIEALSKTQPKIDALRYILNDIKEKYDLPYTKCGEFPIETFYIYEDGKDGVEILIEEYSATLVKNGEVIKQKIYTKSGGEWNWEKDQNEKTIIN